VAQDMTPEAESRGSKKSVLPRSSRVGVGGFVSG
jgi:hypothetical protein